MTVKETHPNPIDPSLARHLRERELAKRWTISERTLQRMRATGQGPRYVMIGGSVRYRLSDVLDYEQRRSTLWSAADA